MPLRHSPIVVFILMLITALVGAQPALAAHPVAWWKFDEAPGTLQAADSIGTHPGTLVDSAAFVTGGKAGNALSLNANGVVKMGDNFRLTSGDFSIIAWIKTSSSEADCAILGKSKEAVIAGYILDLNMTSYGSSGKVTFWQAQPAGSAVTSTTVVNDGVWHQVAVSYHDNDVSGSTELYVDGAPVEAATLSSPIGADSTTEFLIGGYWGAQGQLRERFIGLVDQVQLYDDALTSTDVQYQFEHPPELAPEPATLSLLALGGLGALLRRWRR